MSFSCGTSFAVRLQLSGQRRWNRLRGTPMLSASRGRPVVMRYGYLR
ncbi:hypothetical protein RSSM_05260 [Rhodopirellula sallentina SM41]|uniref:Uncharacterized protein n=1 Tax=Rhodopirellula sallentina SM41 TaxID=1263870 RepID=M5TVR0_9BACT|nr:hypothetical protein RSSM_05260 [Rhodopirellula sallentina SM41]